MPLPGFGSRAKSATTTHATWQVGHTSLMRCPERAGPAPVCNALVLDRALCRQVTQGSSRVAIFTPHNPSEVRLCLILYIEYALARSRESVQPEGSQRVRRIASRQGSDLFSVPVQKGSAPMTTAGRVVSRSSERRLQLAKHARPRSYYHSSVALP
jgi:hypothetical protein